MSKEQKKREDGFEHLEEALTSGEQFIEKNQKMIVNVVLVLVVIIAGYFGYNRFIAEPHAQEAASQIFGAQNYFEKDSFNLALNGDGNVLGFIEIADKYSSTPSGNLAKYYAGLSYLYMGEYQNAIQYLEKFSSDDLLLSNLAKANIGDAYMQLGEYRKAAENYKKAAASKTNDFSTPTFLMKNGLALEKSNDYSGALKVYEQIEQEYPASPGNGAFFFLFYYFCRSMCSIPHCGIIRSRHEKLAYTPWHSIVFSVCRSPAFSYQRQRRYCR